VRIKSYGKPTNVGKMKYFSIMQNWLKICR